MRYGLSEDTLDKILSVIQKHKQIDQVVLYGSRATGKYKKGSDVDLAIKGKDVGIAEVISILTELDELDLPYQIDLCAYPTITNQEMKEQIDAVGKVLYQA